MKTPFLVLTALVFAIAPMKSAMASDPDPVKAAKALEELKADVAALQASQKPMHDADKAYDDAKGALDKNKDDTNKKKDEIKKAKSDYDDEVKQIRRDADRHGGATAEVLTTLHDKLVAWQAKDGTLRGEQAAFEKTRSETLQPAFDAAKAEKTAKDGAHETAAKATETKAKEYSGYRCFETNGGIGNVVGGIGRGIGSAFSDLNDDCKEVRGKVRPGLCKKEDINAILALVGIDAKSKNCGPANSGGGISGAGNGGGISGAGNGQ